MSEPSSTSLGTESPMGTLRIPVGFPARMILRPGSWISPPTGKVSRSTRYPSSLSA